MNTWLNYMTQSRKVLLYSTGMRYVTTSLTGDFEWVNIDPNEIDKLTAHTNKDYILEVDVKSYTICVMNYHSCVRGWR